MKHIKKIHTANKARVLEYELLLLLFTAEVGERVDNDAEYQVEYNDDHHEEEQQIVNHSSHEQRFLGEIVKSWSQFKSQIP